MNNNIYSNNVFKEMLKNLIIAGMISIIISVIFFSYWTRIISNEFISDNWITYYEGLLLNLFIIIFIWISSYRRKIDYLEPILFVSILMLLIFIIRPIQILFDSGRRIYFFDVNIFTMNKALYYGAIGNVSFYFGYLSKRKNYINKIKILNIYWSKKRLCAITMVYISLGIVGTIIAVIRSGGLKTFIYGYQGRALLTASNSQIFSAMTILLYVGSSLIGSYYFRTKTLKLWFLLSIVLSTMFGLLSGGRATILIYFISMAVIYFYSKKPNLIYSIKIKISIILALIIAMIFIVNLGTRRMNIQKGVIDANIRYSMFEYANKFIEEFCQYDWFVNVIANTPKVIPYQNGKTFLEIFLQYIPRFLWKEKPYPIEYRITSYIAGYESGSPFTLIGELYLNFRLIGIIIGMFLFGIISGSMYSFMRKNIGDSSAIIIYSYYYASLLHFYTRSFAPMVFIFTLYIIPIIFATKIIEKKHRCLIK